MHANIQNAMSVDVEEYFQVHAFAGRVSPLEWEGFPSRVEAATHRLLAAFAMAGARATFFTLGWVAARHPALIRRIVAEGHELASHGHGHAPIHRLGPAGFRADIRHAKSVLEDIAGLPVRGYRAPGFSLGRATPWAHTILAEEGHAYSSSTFPIRHDTYGEPGAPRTPYCPPGAALWELPMTTLRLGGHNLPCAGGGYFRLMPYRLFRHLLRRVNRREARPGIFYLHPWEADPAQPRIPGIGRKARLRHTLNLGAVEGRLGALLADFAWDRIDRVFAAELGSTAWE